MWVLAGRFVTTEMAIFSDKFLYFLGDWTLVSSSCRVVSKNRRVRPAPGSLLQRAGKAGPAVQPYKGNVAVGEVIRGDGGERKALGLCLDSAQVLPDWTKM